MLSKLWRRIISRANNVSARPLVSPLRDIHLLRAVHGNRLPRWRQICRIGTVLSPSEHRLLSICTWIAVAGVIWLGAVTLGRYRRIAPAVGGAYSEAVVGSPQLINPLFAPLNDVDQDLSALIYTGLMRHTKDQELAPDLAASYEVSADKKTYTFRLRKDVLWHDREPFSAKDVLYTFQTIQDAAVASPLRISFQGVKVAAPDDYTVIFTLSEPFAPFLSSLTVGILPEHIWFDVTAERMRLHKNNIQPIGTGPYMFKKLAKDDSGTLHAYELTRFEGFYRGPPYIKDFTFRFFSDYVSPSGAIQALRGQQADGLSFVPHDLRSRVERKHIELHTLQLPQYTALFWNQEAEPALKQSAVRQALGKAIDKERVLREALKGEGQIIESPILPGFPGYNPEAVKLGYNSSEAGELLDKDWARITADEYRKKREEQLFKEREQELTVAVSSTAVTAEGAVTTSPRDAIMAEIAAFADSEMNPAQTYYRQNKDGVLLSLSLVTADTPEYRQAAALIAGFWEEIGVATAIKTVDAKDLSRQALKNRDYDVLLYGVILGSDSDQYAFWHSSQVDYPGLNLSHYINRTVDTLLERMRATDNEEELIESAKKFQDAILSDRPALFLYIPTYTYATSDKVRGIDVTRIFHPADRFANVTEWYVKTKGEWKFK